MWYIAVSNAEKTGMQTTFDIGPMVRKYSAIPLATDPSNPRHYGFPSFGDHSRHCVDLCDGERALGDRASATHRINFQA